MIIQNQNRIPSSIMKKTFAPSSTCLCHHFTLPFPESVGELRFVMLVDQVIKPRLSTELVDALSDFVPCCIP